MGAMATAVLEAPPVPRRLGDAGGKLHCRVNSDKVIRKSWDEALPLNKKAELLSASVDKL